MRNDAEASSSSARSRLPPLILLPGDGGEQRSCGQPHNSLRRQEKDDDGKATGKPQVDDASISGNDVMRKLRQEAQEDGRGHAILEERASTRAPRREPSSQFAPRPS